MQGSAPPGCAGPIEWILLVSPRRVVEGGVVLQERRPTARAPAGGRHPSPLADPGGRGQKQAVAGLPCAAPTAESNGRSNPSPWESLSGCAARRSRNAAVWWLARTWRKAPIEVLAPCGLRDPRSPSAGSRVAGFPLSCP